MIKYWIVDKKGKRHGWCLTNEFARMCCGRDEMIVLEKK